MMKVTELQWQTAGGVSLFARQWRPEGEVKGVVCLVHGLGEHSGRYGHVAAVLTGAGYALLAIDLPGHGKTEGKRGHATSYDALLDIVGLLLEKGGELYPGLPRFLYGHSMGGNLVINYALRRRPALAGVVATSPWLGLANEPPAVLAGLVGLLSRVGPAMTIPNGLKVADLSRDLAVVKAYQDDPLVHDRISLSLLKSMIESGKWAQERAADFPLPLLLMHGTADRITSAEMSGRFGRAAANTTLKLWEGFYHETHNEPEQGEVLAMMVWWLEGKTAAVAKG